VAEEILAGLVKAEQRRAELREIPSYWKSFEFARDPRTPQDDRTLARGAFHVIALDAPYLRPRERELFDELAKGYIA
jgi:hypothetical protein